MDFLVTTYIIYAAAAVALTGVLARTLFRNGRVFLEDVFPEQAGLAEAVNHLLVIGFYMLNLGYAFMLFRSNNAETGIAATEILVTKLGVLLLSLGVIHFVNVTVFWKLRNRNRFDLDNPPVNATAMVPPPPPAGAQPVPA